MTSPEAAHTSPERAPCLANLPGALNAKALGFGPPECAFFSFPGLCGRFAWLSAMFVTAYASLTKNASMSSSAQKLHGRSRARGFRRCGKASNTILQNFETSGRASAAGRDAPSLLSIRASATLAWRRTPPRGRCRCSTPTMTCASAVSAHNQGSLDGAGPFTG